MSEQDRPPVQGRVNPALLIFLIFPILGVIAAVLTSRPGGASSGVLTPPPAVFTPTTLVGSTAPDFTLINLAGQPVQLSSMRGRWVYMNFWATWCGPCRREMPTFQKLLTGGFGDYSGKLTVLAINRDETADKVRAYLVENEVEQVPVVLDPEGKVNNRYGILQLPITMVLDPQGIVRYEQFGEMTPDLLKQYLAEVGSPNSLTF